MATPDVACVQPERGDRGRDDSAHGAAAERRIDPCGARGGLSVARPQRLEVSAASVSNGQATAVVGTTPPLARYHETNDHRHGRPWVRVDAEAHGTGVALTGTVAGEIGELARDRQSGTAQTLAATHASTPSVYAATSGGGWAAVLRTTSAISDADAAYLAIVNPPGADQDIQAQFGGTLATPALRALRRRYLAGRWGIREGEVSIQAALARAHRFSPPRTSVGVCPQT